MLDLDRIDLASICEALEDHSYDSQLVARLDQWRGPSLDRH